MLSSVKLCEIVKSFNIFQGISTPWRSSPGSGSPGSTVRWSWSTGKPFGPTRRRRTAVALWATDVQQNRCSSKYASHGDSDDSSCAQFSVWRARANGNLRFDCNAARANWQAAWSEAPGNEFECHCDNWSSKMYCMFEGGWTHQKFRVTKQQQF